MSAYPAATALLVILTLAPCSAALAARASEAPDAHPLAVGEPFPALTLSGTLSAEQAAFLGVEDPAQPVALNDIQARVLILEVFSMYCPHCQREAPETVKLYDLIAARGLDDRMKLVGLGVGNSQTEVDVFRDKYGLPFPLFPDFDFAAHEACGGVGTPYFYVLLRDDNGEGYTVAVSRLGQMESPELFVDEILAATGLE